MSILLKAKTRLFYIPSQWSAQFSHSVTSDSLRPHGLQRARVLCPLTPGACSNSCVSSWWCHPTISSSVVPFSSCLQTFPASRSFPLSQFFLSGCQSVGVSASASVLPMNIQELISYRMNWLALLAVQGTLKSLLQLLALKLWTTCLAFGTLVSASVKWR